MSSGARVAAFAAGLVAIFALAALAGRALDPATEAADRAERATPAAAAHDEHEAARAGASAAAGLRLVADTPTTLRPRAPGAADVARRRAHGTTVGNFETEQARRDASDRRAPRPASLPAPASRAGRGRRLGTAVTLPDAGVYHAFADFRTAGERHTPGVDLFAGGRFEPLALPPPSNVAATDGYDVALRDDGTRLRFSVALGGSCAATCSPTSARAATSSSCARAICVRARPSGRCRRPGLRDRRPRRPGATGCSCSFATPTGSTRPPSPRR